MIFISWSGERGKLYAAALDEWLKKVVTDVDTFFSPKIEPGERSYSAIEEGLRQCNYGILCITQEALSSTWLHFEAGAISNALARTDRIVKERVVPLVFDNIPTANLEAPLTQFQYCTYSKETMLRIAEGANRAEGNVVSGDTLKTYFEVFWQPYHDSVGTIAATPPTAKSAERPTPDILDEILNLVRSLSRGQTLKSDIYSVVYAQALEDEALIDGTARIIQERAANNGLRADLIGPGLVLIDGSLVIGIARTTPSVSPIKACLDIDDRMLETQKILSLDGPRIVVLVGRESHRKSAEAAPLRLSKDPFVWFSANVFLGNIPAKRVAPWLLDSTFTADIMSVTPEPPTGDPINT